MMFTQDIDVNVVSPLAICGLRGPIFFRQRRVGHQGREFTCCKFRMMHVGAETDSHTRHTALLIKSEPVHSQNV